MLFKNLVFHRLPADWTLSATELETALAGRTLRPCGPFDMSTRGWVPVTHGGRLVHTVGRQHLVALGVDEKLLPASVVRQVAQERADLLAAEQGFPVGRKQMRDLKLQVADELRARAFTRRRVTRAWLDTVGGWFAVDASSLPRAEAVVETLSDTLGSFAPQPIETARSPQLVMASWLLGATPARLSIDDELEVQSVDRNKSVVRYTRHPLDAKEIRGHLSAGKYPTRLGVTWNDRVAFVLTDKLQVKRLEFLDFGKDPAGDTEVDAAEQFDIDFTVMAGELGGLLADLTACLATPAAAPTATAGVGEQAAAAWPAPEASRSRVA